MDQYLLRMLVSELNELNNNMKDLIEVVKESKNAEA